MNIMSRLEGVRYTIATLGCRTNQAEAEALCSAFDACGAVFVEPSAGGLDVAICLSCSVTSAADAKTRKLVRALRRDHPNALVVLTGCYAQLASPERTRELGVDAVIGNRLKGFIPEWVAKRLEENKSQKSDENLVPDRGLWRRNLSDCDDLDSLFLARPRRRTRAFVKIQEGCDHFCSYCIVPYARGKPVSRPVADVLREVEGVIGSGCREIVLTGVHLGLYVALPELVEKIGSMKGLARLRFGSLEPFAVTPELLARLRDCAPFCRHLHLPLQSGDDGVLAAMHRGYNVGEFLAVVSRVRAALGDDVHISSDVMVGFPGEDERAFENTLEAMRRARFGKVHVFPFSPREGTDAWSLPGRLPDFELSRRVKKTNLLADELLDTYARSWLGKDVDVLVERVREGVWDGLTSHYVRAFFDFFDGPIPEPKPGTIVRKNFSKSFAGSLYNQEYDSRSIEEANDII